MVVGTEGHGTPEKGQGPGGVQHRVPSVGMAHQEDIGRIDGIGFGYFFPGPPGQGHCVFDAVREGIGPFAAPGSPVVGTDHYTAHPAQALGQVVIVVGAWDPMAEDHRRMGRFIDSRRQVDFSQYPVSLDGQIQLQGIRQGSILVIRFFQYIAGINFHKAELPFQQHLR